MSKGNVAIIGAGFGGLAAARFLKSQGFVPRIFEMHDDIGGQWNRRNANSGVWPEMRVNTARFVTRLSDIQYPDGTAMFPRNTEVAELINAFADLHGLRSHLELRAKVTRLASAPEGGYDLTWEGNGPANSSTFDYAVVATGRFNKPEFPDIPGLDGFTGECGAIHAFHYKEPAKYRDKRVVVLGGSISALEIASDLSMMGTKRVYMSQRRQRYVMPKMIAGTPLEYFAFTREGALEQERLPLDEVLANTKEFLLAYGGDPARYGAPPTHEDMAKAGVAGSQHYLNLVAEDRIDVRPWIESVSGSVVKFTDGGEVEADAIIIGTGFDLHLPFLSRDIAQTIKLGRKGMVLSDFTFHPDLERLAFVGLWAQLGPYPVVLEQQARYIAYAWSGAISPPARKELERGLSACVAEDHHADYRQQHEMAIRFARLAGTDPAGYGDEEFQEILAKSAVTGEMFRIVGTDCLPDAEQRVRDDFDLYGIPEVRKGIAERFGKSGQ
ncbi:MAG: FAD-dependent oxidoreductase [Albidovulum sp.]|nr:FAD-dependent oxidoreductase [Albidovulum sp.]